MDLAAGYWQIPLAPEDISKSAFILPNGKYEWLCMPFGMVGAPNTFQRLMDLVLSGLLYETCFVCLDIIIFSKMFQELLDRLRTVLQKLRESKLMLK